MSKIIIPPFAQSRFTHSPLIYGGGIRKVAGGGLSVSFTDSTTSTAETITAPASIDAGDLLILSDVAKSTFSIPTSVTPAGWTNFIDYSALSGSSHVGTRCMVSYKIADGTEDSSSITGMNGGGSNYKVMLQFRGNIPIASVTPNVIGTPAVIDTDPSSQSVTASGGTPPLIILAQYSADSTNPVDPRTFTAAADGELSATTQHYVKYKIYNSSPSNHTVDMDDEGTNNALASCYLELA